MAAFLVMNYIVLPAYVDHGSTLTVPALSGTTFDRAASILDSLGLQAVKSDTRPDPDAPLGTIVNQNPLPGSVVKGGRRVYLTVSGGEAVVYVPSLRGRSLRDAKFALERGGLTLGDVEYAASDSFPQNTVIQQFEPPGKQLPKGSNVGVLISIGAMREQVETPDLTGKTLSEVERILAKHGLKVGTITYQSSFDLLPNTVVDQFPRPGDLINTNGTVDLFVMKAGKPRDEIQKR
jgi:beta-lactam-binding protein with PASTA domain